MQLARTGHLLKFTCYILPERWRAIHSSSQGSSLSPLATDVGKIDCGRCQGENFCANFPSQALLLDNCYYGNSLHRLEYLSFKWLALPILQSKLIMNCNFRKIIYTKSYWLLSLSYIVLQKSGSWKNTISQKKKKNQTDKLMRRKCRHLLCLWYKTLHGNWFLLLRKKSITVLTALSICLIS